MYLGIPEVSAYLNIPKTEVYKLVKIPHFPAVKLGRQWRIKRDLLDKWFTERTNRKVR